MYRLDRTAFQMGRVEEQSTRQAEWWKTQTMEDRLAGAWYMICTAWGLDYEHPPRLDKIAFSSRKLNAKKYDADSVG